MKRDHSGKYKEKLSELLPSSKKRFTKISCTSCKHEIPAEDININDKIAKCKNCNAVFSFQKEVADLSQTKEARQEIIRPEGIDLFHFEEDMDITLQQPINTAETLLGLLLPMFAVVFTIIYLGTGNISFLFPTILWMMSALPLANLLFRSKQKIHIIIDNEYLSILRRPKKMIKDQYYRIVDIDQLYVKTAHGIHSIYMLVDGVNGQKHIKLISHLDSISKAKYLEQEIEKHLNITNKKVPEESP